MQVSLLLPMLIFMTLGPYFPIAEIMTVILTLGKLFVEVTLPNCG